MERESERERIKERERDRERQKERERSGERTASPLSILWRGVVLVAISVRRRTRKFARICYNVIGAACSYGIILKIVILTARH